MDEPFGVDFEHPAQPDCPDCDCCSADLCGQGRNDTRRCVGRTAPEHQVTVHGCPCSAATTVHTAAWRMGQVGVTLRARSRPLASDVEAYLRALAEGEVWAGGDIDRAPWESQGLTATIDGRPMLTDLGRTYLAARTDVRIVTPVRVVDVDRRARTARVEVPAWRPGEAVTVPLDQLVSDLDVSADRLPRWVHAEANCEAQDATRLVLTRFRPRVDDGTAVTRVGAAAQHERLVTTRFLDPPPLPSTALVPATGAFSLLVDESDGEDDL